MDLFENAGRDPVYGRLTENDEPIIFLGTLVSNHPIFTSCILMYELVGHERMVVYGSIHKSVANSS